MRVSESVNGVHCLCLGFLFLIFFFFFFSGSVSFHDWFKEAKSSPVMGDFFWLMTRSGAGFDKCITIGVKESWH